MGFRDKLRAKVDKHGGLGGLAKAAIRRADPRAKGTDSAPVTSPAGQSAEKGSLPTECSVVGFTAVAWSDALTPSRPLQIVHEGEAIAVFRAQGSTYAISNVCTHEDGPLAEGEVNGCVVACPYHDWRFDMQTGECLSHKGRQVATWQVREEQGAVWIGPQKSEGAAERGGAHDDGMEVLVKDLDQE
ncbi:MAG: Rieske 2Fe-2S domain-containing protein [Myxococcota bacterium]|nr:Rieske 2Fe-2S domain-containing protein [Myxococcota bacterium]